MSKEDALAKMVGVSGNTISSIETGQFNPIAKLTLILCIALDKKLEDYFIFKSDWSYDWTKKTGNQKNWSISEVITYINENGRYTDVCVISHNVFLYLNVLYWYKS